MSKSKKLSNSASTGGRGVHFEAYVQASFVTLMLTGGYAPSLPTWPIVEIKLQCRIEGVETDDLIVIVENKESKERRKLLGQIKSSIAITNSNTDFKEVIQAAWNDFKNPEVFNRYKDNIALLTGPLSAIDTKCIPWLLNQARCTKTSDEFFRNIHTANFSPAKSTEKLEIILHHLKSANDGNEVSRDELYDFLKCFYLFSYDLDNEFSVVLSLLHSQISQFQQQYPHWVWARIVQFVEIYNQNAGTITRSKLPEDLLDVFKQKVIMEIPEVLHPPQEQPKTDWIQLSDATYLTLAVLIGAWQDNNLSDQTAINHRFGISYKEWMNKAREILLYTDSPLTTINGSWKVINRANLWNLMGSHILDQDLDHFKALAISVLKETDPIFELPIEERFIASVHGKGIKHSPELRNGIAEGLAFLGTQSEVCIHCSMKKAETTCISVVHELLSRADYALWGSLDRLLPILAEAAPNDFLKMVENALNVIPCPFDDLFKEGNNTISYNYLTGLLWALEGLAWDEQLFVTVCVTLAELVSHDLGGHNGNRPFNSLVTIFLPWLPQTLASANKQKVAIKTLFLEQPDIAWKLFIQLLPSQHQTSVGTHKPKWRNPIPDDWKPNVTYDEYSQQMSYYEQLALNYAEQDISRLSELIGYLDSLQKSSLERFLQILVSKPILMLPEVQRASIFDKLIRLTNKHRRFSDARWTLSNEWIERIEHVANQFAPTNPFILYQHLFNDCDIELFRDNGDWEYQRKELVTQREIAISEIFKQGGISEVIRFAESVSSPKEVGYALGVIDDPVIESNLLPSFLNSEDQKHKALVSGFIWKRFLIKDWKWCDSFKKSNWTPEQTGHFLACLPFTKKTWARASKWLQKCDNQYWCRANVIFSSNDDDLGIAINKLIIHGRPEDAINCLNRIRSFQSIDSQQCVRALLSIAFSPQKSNSINKYNCLELIKYLQSEPSVKQNDLLKIEWAYIPWLDGDWGVIPKLHYNRLANDPKMFCKMIRYIYRSSKEKQSLSSPTNETEANAINAWRLLQRWDITPGTQQDGSFSDDDFNKWLNSVKKISTKSGHLDVALIKVGEVLIHSPADPDGLWIHRSVATALNDRKADNMRRGYMIGVINSRGGHWIDPTGKPEKELAMQYRNKAEIVENAGFHRFAITLRKLADDYENEADQIIARF